MLTLIVLSAALLQEPPAPPAPPHPPEHGSRFLFVGGDGVGRLDADGDGQVTREEFGAPLNNAFARMDKDGDGRLSTAELADGRSPGDHEVAVLLDSTGPGGRRFEFRRPESGEDLRVEGDVARTAVFVGARPGSSGERELVLRGAGGGEPLVVRLDGDEGPGRIEVRRFGGPGGDHESSGDLDKDGDGKVSEAEFTARLREAFAHMDADRSGFIEDGERGARGDVQVITRRIERREGGE